MSGGSSIREEDFFNDGDAEVFIFPSDHNVNETVNDICINVPDSVNYDSGKAMTKRNSCPCIENNVG